MCLLTAHLQQCRSSLGADFYFRVFIEHHYGYDGFFGEVVGEKYLLYVLSVYGAKCLGVVDE